MSLVQQVLALLALAALVVWLVSSDSESQQVDEKTLQPPSTDSLQTETFAPTQNELEALQQEHLSQLDPENPFTVEYTYPQSENLSEEEVAQFESERILENRWEEIRAFNGGELPYVTEEDKIIAAELMREEGLTSVYEHQP